MYLKFEHSYFELLFSTFPGIYTILITWNSQELSSWLLCIPNVTQNKWIVLGNSPFPKFCSPFLLSFTNAISNNYCVYVFKTNKQTTLYRRNKKFVHRSCNFASTENFHIPFFFLQKPCLKIYMKTCLALCMHSTWKLWCAFPEILPGHTHAQC